MLPNSKTSEKCIYSHSNSFLTWNQNITGTAYVNRNSTYTCWPLVVGGGGDGGGGGGDGGGGGGGGLFGALIHWPLGDLNEDLNKCFQAIFSFL